MKRKLLIAGLVGIMFMTACSDGGENKPAEMNNQIEVQTEALDEENTGNDTKTEQQVKTAEEEQKQPDAAATAQNAAPQEQTKKDEVKQEAKNVQPQEVKPEGEQKEAQKEDEVKKVYKDGTYSGKAKGYAGDITVSVTIENDKIKAVKVTDTIDDEPYISQAKELTADIVAKNSASVDGVSGATYSSDGIKNAVKNALSKAKN